MLTDEPPEGRLTRVEEDTLLPLVQYFLPGENARRAVRHQETARAPKDGVTR